MIAFLAFCLVVAVVPLAVLVWLALRLDRHWEKVFWLLAVILACVNYRVWTSSRFDDRMGLDVALAIILTAVSLVLFTVPLAVRVAVVRKAPSAAVKFHPAGAAVLTGLSKTSDWLAAILLAAILPSMFLIWFGLLARMSGLAAVALVAAMALACAAVYRRLAWWPDAVLKRIFAVGFLTFLTIGLVAAGTAALVLRSAADMAAGRPYCIESGAAPVRTIFDLSILTLRERPVAQHGGGARYLGHHAILAVDDPEGRKVFHWSYGSWAFKEDSRLGNSDTSSAPAIACVPASGTGYSWF